MSNGNTVTLPELEVQAPAPAVPATTPAQQVQQAVPPQPVTPRTDAPLPATGQNPQEIAQIIVAGRVFGDWESVHVTIAWAEPASQFSFTSVERDTDPPTDFYQPQFLPGTPCQINLAGIQIIDGWIEKRVVEYDGHRHSIEIMGRSQTIWTYKSSVNTENGSFDGMTFEQTARKVLSGYPGQIKVIGSLDATPFNKLQNQKGEQIWDFLERIARGKGIILGSDPYGNYLLIGPHNFPIINTQLIEGQNIKRAQCLFQKDQTYQVYNVSGQTAGGSNGVMFGQASEITGSWGGSAPSKSYLDTPMEHPPLNQQEAIKRAQMEALWHEAPQIEANITVQGWLRDGANLWWPGDKVLVYAPMCPLYMVMKIQQAIFTQDSEGGTETTLQMVPPWGLLDSGGANVGTPKNVPSTGPTYVPSPTAPTPQQTQDNVPM